jgi:hypothetical protein|tara:strand:- start:832 stop:1011 length:180 start_codon:yes stop_codon:yes gene_type:complete
MDYIKGKKTYIVAGMMVAISLFKIFTGDMSLMELMASNDLMLLLEGFGLATLRKGISNG